MYVTMTFPNNSVIAASGWNKQNIYLSIYLLAKYHLKNYGDRESASVHNTLRDLHKSSDDTKAKFNNGFIIHSK